MREILIRFVMIFSMMLVAFGLLGFLTKCTPEQAKTVKDITIKVADDVCAEEAKQPDAPDWVGLACGAEPIVHLVLPREQWYAIKARSKRSDAGAGPGK